MSSTCPCEREAPNTRLSLCPLVFLFEGLTSPGFAFAMPIGGMLVAMGMSKMACAPSCMPGGLHIHTHGHTHTHMHAHQGRGSDFILFGRQDTGSATGMWSAWV